MMTERSETAGMPLSPEQVATMLFEKAVALGQAGRSEEAVAVYEDVVRRFGTATGPVLRRLE